MKSGIFSSVDLEANDSIKRDCQRFLRIKSGELKRFLPIFSAIHQAHDDDERMQRARNAASALGVSLADVASAVNLLGFITARLVRPDFAGDKPEDIAADISLVGGAGENRVQELAEFFVSLKNYATKDRAKLRARQFEEIVVSSLVDFQATVDVRPLFDRGELPKDTGYFPKLLGVVPIVLLRIETSSNTNDEVVLQLTEDQVPELIAKLSNILKELKSAKDALRLQP